MKKHALWAALLLFMAGCEIFSDDGAEFEFGQAVVAAADGGYLIVGSAPRGGDHVARLHAYDRRDRLGWRRSLTAGEYHMLARDAVTLEEGGYLVVGYTYGSGEAYDPTSYAVLRTSREGRLLWHKVYGGEDDELTDALLTSDRKLLVSGAAGGIPWSYGDEKGYWALMDLDGALIWEQTDSTFQPVDIVEAHDGGYMAISNAGADLVRLRADGAVAWRRRLEQANGVGFILAAGGDGALLRHGDGYVVVGATTDDEYNPHLLVLKVDAAGEVIWSKTLHEGVGVDALAMEGGALLIAGVEVTYNHEEAPFTHHLPYAALIDGSGQLVWEHTYASCSASSFPVSAALPADGDVLLAGSFYDGRGDARVLRLRLKPDGTASYAECN